MQSDYFLAMFNRPQRMYLLAAFAFFMLAVPAIQAALTNFPSITLPSQFRGEQAIQGLGNRLPEVAAIYHKTSAELQSLLRRDKDALVDTQGHLLYTCDFGPLPKPGPEVNTPVKLMAPLSQTFFLHSRPGAHHIIYLCFIGYTLSGTAWNSSYNAGADIVAPAFDTDGDPSTFSTGEQTEIQQIWLRVAEDYAPYEVDVTTEYPGEAALTRSDAGDDFYGMRALISPISSYVGNYGGIAYVGVYAKTGDLFKPALIFPEHLANDEKYIAEAVSHEVGHTLGLDHDGTTTGSAYYSGQGNWAPIMGVGYYEPISQWSKGEYANANNLQDDLSIITQNGLAYRADDFGNTIATAAALTGVNIFTNGVIGRTNDVDFFSFLTGAGVAQITVSPWERGANLHLLVSIYDGSGTLLSANETADTSSGVQPVTVNFPVNTGNYYVSVEGIGSGDPLTSGYSDYDSLGNYTVAITLPASTAWLPSAGGNYSWTNTANWLSASVPNSADVTAAINNNLIGNQFITLDSPLTIGRLLLGDSDGSHGFTIQDGTGGPLTFDVTSGNASIIKSGGSNDVIAARVALKDDLSVSNSSSVRLTFAGQISGSRNFIKSGAGVVGLAGTNTLSAFTTIASGTLALDSTVRFTSNVVFDVRSGAVLDVTAVSGGFFANTNQTVGGTGNVLGDVTLNPGGSMSPGSTNAFGTLTFNNNLLLSGGAIWSIDLANTNTPGGGTNDLVVVAGNVSLNGTNKIVINALNGTLASPATYTILNYGTLTGGAGNLIVTSSARYNFVVDDSTFGQIKLNVTAGPANLTWHGDGTLNRWDIAGATNWLNTSFSDLFFQFDSVTFDDTGSNSPAINLVGAILPTSVKVNATKNYIFGGTGKITGTTMLTKLGSGTLTISNANDFTGQTTVSGGVLRPILTNAVGDINAPLVITNGGALDLNGLNFDLKPVIVSGTGSGNGAIFNSGAQQFTAFRSVTLTGDTTFGGTNRWDIRANPTASLNGNGYKLTKTNSNDVWLVGLGDTGLGNIEVRQGVLGIQNTTTLGNVSSNMTVFPGASLVFWDNNANILNKSLALSNAIVRNDSGNNIFAGPVLVSSSAGNSNTFNIVSSLEMRGNISGSGAVTKTGNGTLILTGSNTFTGILYADKASSGVVSDGIVKLASSDALKSAAQISIRNTNSAPSTVQLDGSSGNITTSVPIVLSGRNSATPAIQNLAGNNTLSGNLSIQNGGSNYLLQCDSGSLTLNGMLPIAGFSGLHVISFLGAGDFIIGGTLQNGTGAGTMAFTKNGTGTLTLNTAATHTGTNTILKGAVVANASNAFGTGTIILNSATDNARVVLGNNVTITNRIFAITANPGASLGLLMVNDNTSATFSGPITFGANASSGGHILGPVSSGLLNFTGTITATNPGAFVVIQSGNVRFSGGGIYPELRSSANTTSLGANNGISTGAVIDIGGNGGTTTPTVLDLNGFNQTLAGLKDIVTPANAAWVTNSAATISTLTLNNANANQIFGGSIIGKIALTLNAGSQTLAKSSGSTSLNGVFAYTGNTTLNGGSLILASGISLPNTPIITLGAGTTLDVSAAGLTLGSSQILQGNGVVLGDLTTSGIVSPGVNSLGAFTFANNLTFNSTTKTILEINHTGQTNDAFNVTGTFTYGGDLYVTNIGVAPLGAGDTFKLFNAGSYLGAWNSVTLPALNVGLVWDTSNLSNGIVSVAVSDFGLAVAPSTYATQIGGTVAYAVTVTATNGYSGNVVFSVSGLPAGAGADFSPASVNGAGSSTLTVTTSNNIVIGNYPLIITGTGGALVHNANVTLSVNDFMVVAAPSILPVLIANSTSYTVTIRQTNGFIGDVTLSVDGLPPGTSYTLSDTNITGSGTATVNITTTTNVALGNYPLTITGTNGTLVHSTNLILSVNDFSVSAAPFSQAVAVGQPASYTVNVSASNNFAGSVVFGLSGLPAGAGAVFNPASVTGAGASTLTLTASNGIGFGDYPLTINATNSGQIRLASILLSVSNSVFISTDSTNIIFTLSGSDLELSWPPDHTGWRLQSQTNEITSGIGTNWFDVIGSTLTNRVLAPLDPNIPSVFFRLIYP